jgi:hypothetical protein
VLDIDIMENQAYIKYMKLCKLIILFVISLMFNNCGHTKKIIYKDYKYEKEFFGTHIVEFDIHLENIGNSGKISDLITKLIYHDKNFEEYTAHREKEFIEFTGKDFYPPRVDENGMDDFYRSNMNLSYSIEYSGVSYVIVKQYLYYFYSGAAHGNYWTECSTIDLSEKRVLGINDLVNPIPDDLLKKTLESGGNARYYLRENIWPPDTINISKDNIELIWNQYQITPYSDGIININSKNLNIEQYLTNKGKALKRSM